ncbi:HlyD family type I secretion periplasmic adaptor subunit [Benzoatithermus flavus]|uniref:Membrane fusion protein (MFP) family protein n=1 Tax=Benzoatithermus flavus TaxID=3108223 RepID=A0ABU8XT15_9PROT
MADAAIEVPEPPEDAAALLDAKLPLLAGALIATIAALVLALLGWLAWAEVDEVVRATGTVEPAGRVKIVNHPHGGRVVAIHVREGQRVEAGAPLVTFDGEVARSEHAERLGRLQMRTIEAARLAAEAEGRALEVEPALAEARPDLVAAQRALLEARDAAQRSRREAQERVIQTRRDELRTAAAEVGRLRNSLTLLKQQQEAVQALNERGLYPTLKLVQVQKQLSDNEGELAKAEAALAAARSALAESESRLDSLDKEHRSEVLAELGAVSAERDQLAEQLRAQATLLDDLVVTAPAPGIVQEITVTAPGQAVAPQETLMKLVPDAEGLVVEARVANQDVGRLRPGMPATVKVRAFDYLRYGSLEGTLQKVNADATPDPRTGELAYGITVVTARDHLGRARGEHDVVPGMVVDVELKVGERTILSYLTDRIFRMKEAFREG